MSVALCKAEESDPLKQGLKPNLCDCRCKGAMAEESDPLKQGLKHDLDVKWVKKRAGLKRVIH